MCNTKLRAVHVTVEFLTAIFVQLSADSTTWDFSLSRKFIYYYTILSYFYHHQYHELSSWPVPITKNKIVPSILLSDVRIVFYPSVFY